MPYRFTTFNGIVLPAVMPEDDLSTPQAASTIVDSLAGGFDFLGNNRYQPKRHMIRYRGMYVAQTDYLVDEAGNRIVDESGNYIVIADGAQILRSRIDDIKAQHGKRGYLVRRREDDGAEHYKYARLQSVQHIRTLRDVDRVANLELVFEAEGRPWRSTFGTEATGALGANAVTPVGVTTAGDEQVRDAIITITATSTITGAAVYMYGANNYYLEFSGSTVSAGQSLQIDCGQHTVKVNGSDAYRYFRLYPGIHTGPDWLILEPNVTNQLYVALSGGGGTASVLFTDQYP